MRQPRKVNKNLYKDSIEYDTNCTSITARQWAKLMDGSERASGKLIRRMIKKQGHNAAKWADKAKVKLTDYVEGVFQQFSNPLVVVARFSNGETIYKQCN